MPDYLTVPSTVACLVLCAGLVASVLGLATDDWLEIKQISTSSVTNDTNTTVVRYGLWRRCFTTGNKSSEHCHHLVDEGTTTWVMASAVMMIYATVASGMVLVLWTIWTFFITKRPQSCLKSLTVVLTISSVFFFFVVFIGWIAERKNTAKDFYNEEADFTYEYEYTFKWSFGMPILAFFLQILAVVLMLISGARD